MNFIALSGFLCKDAQEFTYSDNQPALRASFAVNFLSKDGSTQAEFFNFALFGNQAKRFAQQLKKGALVNVSGALSCGAYTNAAGEQIKQFEIKNASVDLLLNPKSPEASLSAGKVAAKQSYKSVSDLPF